MENIFHYKDLLVIFLISILFYAIIIFIGITILGKKKRKKIGTAYLLLFFGGWLGLHRFYLEDKGMAILYMFTSALGGIGYFYDMFTLTKQINEYNYKNDRYFN